MHRTLRAALMAAVLVGASQPAAAQSTPWEDRVFGGFSFGFDAGQSDISDSRSFVVYDEPGTVSTSATFKADTMLDVSFGVRVWRNLGVAVGYHARGGTGEGEINATVPHPIYYDQPRSYSQPIDGVDRDEMATHLQIGWMVPVNDKFDVFVYAGPSFYRLHQEVVTDLAVAEQGPPYTSIVVQPTFELRKEDAVGYNVGADATYIFYTSDSVRLGIGGFMRFTGATAEIALDDSTTETGLGGFQMGIGARVRF